MTESLHYKTIVLSILGVLVLGMIVVREIGKDSSSLHANSSLCLHWDGLNLNLTGEGNTIQPHPSYQVPPHLRPLFFQPVPINDAGRDLLMTVPGIGPATATNIMRTREKYGAIHCADDLLLVHGIGPKKREKLQNHFSY